MNKREFGRRAGDGLLWLVLVLFLLSILFPRNIFAASYDMSGWIPWWTEEAGAEVALDNLDELDVIYPFVFEVDDRGRLVNKVNFRDDHWDDLFDEADDERVEVIPTIAWFDGPAIHEVLSDEDKRADHIEEIVDMVRQYRFDGVNIDYEQKLAKTIDYFSDFLEELEDELGRRDLSCTVEARMRPEHRWRDDQMPETIQYANDYRAMNRHCDWIEIMAYDQQRADIVFNNERRGVPYNPVADVDWVEHVLEFALEDFDEDKVVLGIPTYGRAWDVTVASEWYKDYELVATLNPPRIEELAEIYDAPIGRTEGGEAVITYFPEDSIWKIFNALPIPAGTPKGYEAAAKALLVATYADIEIPVRMITWSDAKAVEDKLDLADDYDLRGIALFKIDGEEDQDIWDLF
ncbi:MAG: glycosyl hydrolase family 18 protein [Patescibacteria group bacterium]